MRVGIVVGRIGGVDGVALETEKWITVLRRLGHEVFIIAGEYDKDIAGVSHQTLLPILSFFSRKCVWEQRHAFFHPDPDPDVLLTAIRQHATFISSHLKSWISENRIDLLIIQNAGAFPVHLSMGLGIEKALQESCLPTIAHDHDFAWERPNRFDTPHKEINELVEATFPLRLPNVVHAVINSCAQNELQQRYHLESVVVPNVMDFDRPFGVADDYNSTLLKDIGIGADKIVLLQATRIVRRKRIETALELIDRLADPRVILLVSGSHRDDERGEYFDFLLDKIQSRELEDRVFFADYYIRNNRSPRPDGGSLYTLSDAYAQSIACTYFSDIEGFGNAFVEAVLGKKPILVNNYRPVYWPEIGSKGFRTIMIEDNQITEQTLTDTREWLDKPGLREEIAEHNFELGKQHFSYQVLEQKLLELLSMLKL